MSNISKIYTKLNKYIFSLYKAKIELKKPPITKVIIFSGAGRNSEVFYDYMYKNETSILEHLGVKVNIYILFKSFLSRGRYYDSYVNYVSPKILITFIDNSIAFLLIKVPAGCVKITVQNGYRSALNDLYYKLELDNKKK